MERILFIDACMRGPGQSRTLTLCQTFLSSYARRSQDILHRRLDGADLPVMTAELARQREELVRTDPEHPLLLPAREVALADRIVVGAPYWDLSFPAALKVYLEWASVLGVTFRYIEDGRQVGMSRAGELVYITTAGGPIGENDFGYQYLRGWAAMMGIHRTHRLAAENLDLQGTDVDALMAQAGGQAEELARRLRP